MRSSILVIVLLVAGIVLCAGLSSWQYQRAQLKLEIEQRLADDAPAPMTRDYLHRLESGRAQPFGRVILRGRYQPQTHFVWLYRFLQRRSGKEVLSAFQLEGSAAVVMVNRGWMSERLWQKTPLAEVGGGRYESTDYEVASRLAQRLAITPGEGPVTIIGRVWPYPKGWRLGENEVSPIRLSQIEVVPLLYLERSDIEAFYQRSVAAWYLRLDPDQVGGFDYVPTQLPVSSTKHNAYAWQWALLALLQLGFLLAYIGHKLKSRSV